MLDKTMFTKGENETQDYYFFKNEVTEEVVQIIKNKKETHWFGVYDNAKKGQFFTIPVHILENTEKMLEQVCIWYNEGKNEPIYNEPQEVNVGKISPTLTNINNVLGEFPLKSAERIQAYINEPTVDRWEDISSIIVNGWNTVWQLICKEDESFPRSGRSTDATGKIVSDWVKIPTPLEVLRAIKKELKIN